MKRTAHYIRSTHWDREWYSSFQVYRMRLVSMLDEVLEQLAIDPTFKFTMDAQAIPVSDYLEVRRDKEPELRKFAAEGRFRIGPWYVAPDEWLVSGESIIRNLAMGIEIAVQLGAVASRVGFACDQFGHIGQLPQILAQFGIGSALVWRGTNERDHHGHFNWESPDGTRLPTYRFGPWGYGGLAVKVRDVVVKNKFDPTVAVDKLVAYTLLEAARSPLSAILLFDGGDHLEVEPGMAGVIRVANEQLNKQGITIEPSDLDVYQSAIIQEKSKIERTIVGELRETAREPGEIDEQWLIAGCYSSRIHLKQRNAICEDELCLWAEPFSTFASECLDHAYPSDFLRVAWKHLLENQPHDSICGCSIDQVHQDMIYRFDQSLGIAAKLTENAISAITSAAAPLSTKDQSFVVALFNPTSECICEPIDFSISLSAEWSTKYSEFFGFEQKFSFKLFGPDTKEVAYQLVAQRRSVQKVRRERYKYPSVEKMSVVDVTATLSVPPFGYTTVVVEPYMGPSRYLGSMMVSHRTMQNEFLRVTVNPNGTLLVNDLRSGQTYDQWLTFEERADIGDGWFHGIAVADQIYTNAAARAEVALIADGIAKATMRITLNLEVPESFDFRAMRRSERTTALQIVTDVTLRKNVDRIEISTTVNNTVRDHRLRVLCPTGLVGATYLCDSAFDVVERPIQVAADNEIRKELDIETRPQISWTAFGDGRNGLAIISRGIPESAVIDTPDRPIALTLLRSFRKVVFKDDDHGGQIQGKHTFRYFLMPFSGQAPVKKLFLLAARVNTGLRQADHGLSATAESSRRLPRTKSFAEVIGDVVVTSIQRQGNSRHTRLFNPLPKTVRANLSGPSTMKAITCDGRIDERVIFINRGEQSEAMIGPKRIATIVAEY